ncbi:acyl-coenzyme A thioesterase 1-like [Spea bombifrons]|uniref:acyl-coenzyme A thioesterase 1-like n=1 Tax=Spea bombifrons TaxID=233779 RepID=UPI00234A5981|nr:acyl-coenzyme A thioesterase 1-like [Spea bombifrons]
MVLTVNDTRSVCCWLRFISQGGRMIGAGFVAPRAAVLQLIPRLVCSRSMAVSLQVSPGRCLFDEPLQVKVTGLSPGQEVTLQAALTDEGGETFTSVGRYRAGSSGELELSRSPALDGGSFTGIEPEGLLWAMEPQTPFRRLLRKDVQSPQRVDFALYESHEPRGKLLATAAQERSFMGEGVSRIPVREGRVRASLFLPPGPGPFPAIIDLYGTGGGLMEHRASLLASRGFLTMALAYFDYDDLPKDLGGLHLGYFREAVQVFSRHPKVNNQEIGLIGISKGADLALTMATFLPGIKAVVSISGCNANTFAPLPCDGFTLPGLAFSTEKIKFTDFGAMDFSDAMDDPVDPTYQECLIPAEKSHASFLILSGSDDKNWQSALYSEQLVTRLKEHGKNAEYHCYPGAGHLLEPPYFPLCRASYHKLLGLPFLWGGQLVGHARAQEAAWQKIQSFFRKHLTQYNPIQSHL